MASIAAVAQVELKTCSSEDGLGTFIQISGSQVEKQEAVACQRGSDFSVKKSVLQCTCPSEVPEIQSDGVK